MVLNSIEEVANVLEKKVETLKKLEEIKDKLYKTARIPKKNGGKREISKYLCGSKKTKKSTKQRKPRKQKNEKLCKASEVLRDVHDKINNRIFKKLQIPESVHGFVPERSTLTAAQAHVGKKWVVALDISNFFPSVKTEYVYCSLVDYYGFGSEAASFIARIVSYKGGLPQGALTSPMASNVAFAPIDNRIEELCKEHGIIYTRYADDSTFSFDAEEKKDIVLNDIPKIIEEAGYKINTKKTKIFGPNEQHYILGYTVNEKVNVPRKKRKHVENAIHTFVVKHETPIGYAYNPYRYKLVLLGKAYYILHANPKLKRFSKITQMLKEFDTSKYTFKAVIWNVKL